MKKKLLSFTCLLLLTVMNSNAQTTTWDFGNDTVNWPIDGTGVAGNIVNSNLGIYMGITSSNNIGIIESSPKTFPDGYIGQNRFKLNGAGYSGSTFQVMPTQRYIYFATAGNCTIKVWFRTGGSGTRTLYITNGTTVVGSFSGTDSSAGYFFESTYTGSATNLYIYGDQASNLYKIEVTGTLGTTQTLGVDDFTQVTTKVHSYKNQVYVSNVLTASEVKVYNIMGALVKSFTTTTDTAFQLNQSGLYIVNVKTEEGEKSVKVVLN